ncbi:hypothetical protein PC39_14777 [Salinisphaera sp. PC39]|uniref:MAPEG family protein n=1 Tax=Salinisphaera sp. PC39 TaxID=1304156 RepID=UPI0033419796
MSGLFWFQVFVGVNVLIVTLLAVNVSRMRLREQVSLGDGGKPTVRNAVRAHANGVEHVAMFGLLVLALELAAAPGVLLGTLVIAFTVSRLLHPVGMLGTAFQMRRLGAGITFLCEFVGIVALPVVAMTG